MVPLLLWGGGDKCQGGEWREGVVFRYGYDGQWKGGGWRRRILGYCMDRASFGCPEVVAVAKKSEKKKGKKKNRKGDKSNEE